MILTQFRFDKHSNYDSLLSLSIDYSDGVIIYTNNLSSALADRLKKLDKPILDFDDATKENGHTNYLKKHFCKIKLMKYFSSFFLFLFILFFNFSCNEEFNSVGIELVSSTDFKTKIDYFSAYSKTDSIADVQSDRQVYMHIGHFTLPFLEEFSQFHNTNKYST